MQQKPLIIALLAGLSLSGAAQATLIDRGSGMIYDNTLNITWLQNANLAATDTFGVSGINSSGGMNWNTAKQWIVGMNNAGYLGYNNWRLPATAPINGSNFIYSYNFNGTTDLGYNMSAPGTAYAGATGSEMAYLYYNDLGNKGYYDASGHFQAGYGVANAGPFKNLQSGGYWSGTVYAPSTDGAWRFSTGEGFQGANFKGVVGYYALAVRPGDVAVAADPSVPEPETLALFGIGLLGLGLARRRG